MEGLKFMLSSERIKLERLNKGYTVEDVARNLRWFTKYGLHPHLTIMVGYYWQTQEQLWRQHLADAKADIIGVSAGFDNHLLDWGQVLHTEDYRQIGRMVWDTCRRLDIGCFAVLEGGYNHQVLGEAVQAFLQGLQGQ